MRHPTELSKTCSPHSLLSHLHRGAPPLLTLVILCCDTAPSDLTSLPVTTPAHRSWRGTPDSPSCDTIIRRFIPSELILPFSLPGAACLEKKNLFLKRRSCSSFSPRVYGGFIIVWGAHRDAELLTVTRIQKRRRSICYQALFRQHRHVPIAIWSVTREL